MNNVVTANLKITLRDKMYPFGSIAATQDAIDAFEADMKFNAWTFKIIKVDTLNGCVVVHIKTSSEFSDDVSDEYTVQYLVEQDLEDMGWDCDVEVES